MKSKCCNKPLRLSRENPQRGETVYYICEGCNQPADPRPAGDVAQVHLDQAQLHADDYVDKNYPDEREVSKLKEASMQSKPQLSAEMADTYIDPTKQIEKILVDMEKHYCRLNGQDDGYLVKKATMRKLLATALEEQRATFVDEVKNRKATIKWLWGKQKTDDECFLMVMEQVQRIAEFAKLNQLKEGGK